MERHIPKTIQGKKHCICVVISLVCYPSITINDYLTTVYTFFQEKKTLHDTKKASEWMRWWFKEHDSMPEPPTRVLQSAFVLWQQEKVNFKD